MATYIANARLLGSYQEDGIRSRQWPTRALATGGSVNTLNRPALTSAGLTISNGIGISPSEGMYTGVTLVGAESETRGENTALAPRIIAY